MRNNPTRHIVIPEPVFLQPNAAAITFAAFVRDTLLRDRRWGLSLTTLRMGRDLLAAVQAAPPGATLAVPEVTWRLLAAVAAEPQFPQRDGATGGYDPLPAMKLLGFIEAICNATNDAPEEVTRGNGTQDDAIEAIPPLGG